jgi:hypothetical protein
VNIAVAQIDGAAAESAGALGFAPQRRRTNLVDRCHALSVSAAPRIFKGCGGDRIVPLRLASPVRLPA